MTHDRTLWTWPDETIPGGWYKFVVRAMMVTRMIFPMNAHPYLGNPIDSEDSPNQGSSYCFNSRNQSHGMAIHCNKVSGLFQETSRRSSSTGAVSFRQMNNGAITIDNVFLVNLYESLLLNMNRNRIEVDSKIYSHWWNDVNDNIDDDQFNVKENNPKQPFRTFKSGLTVTGHIVDVRSTFQVWTRKIRYLKYTENMNFYASIFWYFTTVIGTTEPQFELSYPGTRFRVS